MSFRFENRMQVVAMSGSPPAKCTVGCLSQALGLHEAIGGLAGPVVQKDRA